MSKTNLKGFTLVEMIVVIVIIMILAGLAAVSFNSLVSETRDNVAELSAQQSARNLDALAALSQMSPEDYADANFQTIIDEAEAGATDLDVSYADGEFLFSFSDGETARAVTMTPGASLGVASVVGESTSTAGGGDSGVSDPYAGWDSYVGSDGVTRYFTAERTGLYTFSFTGVFAGGPTPSDPIEVSGSADIHISDPTADGSVYDMDDAIAEAGSLAAGVSLWMVTKLPQQSAVQTPGRSGEVVLYENAQGHAEWSFDADMTTQWAALSEAEAAAEKVWLALFFTFGDGTGTQWNFEMDYDGGGMPNLVGEPLPAYIG